MKQAKLKRRPKMNRVYCTRVFREVEDAFNAGYSTISAQGGSRSGKTYNIVLWLVRFCLRNPGTSVSVCRATLPSLRGSAMRDFIEIVQDLGVWNGRCFNRSALVYTFENGSFFEFFSVSDEQKVRGRKREILFVNEANELTETEFQQLQLRTTLLAILDYNPSFSEEHWLVRLNARREVYHFITTYKDNPFLAKYFPRVVAEIESLKEKNESLWRVYGLGEQAQIEGLIFPDVEVIERVPKDMPKARHFFGVDYGYSNDPTAIVEVVLNDADKTAYLREVCYRRGMLAQEIIDVFKREPRYKVISESADPRLVDEIYNAGINIHAVKKGAGSIEAGITAMHGWRLYVTQGSANVLREFRNYTYQRDKEGKWLNAPIDAFCDAIDAIRYVFLSEVLGRRTGGGSRAHVPLLYGEELDRDYYREERPRRRSNVYF